MSCISQRPLNMAKQGESSPVLDEVPTPHLPLEHKHSLGHSWASAQSDHTNGSMDTTRSGLHGSLDKVSIATGCLIVAANGRCVTTHVAGQKGLHLTPVKVQ